MSARDTAYFRTMQSTQLTADEKAELKRQLKAHRDVLVNQELASPTSPVPPRRPKRSRRAVVALAVAAALALEAGGLAAATGVGENLIAKLAARLFGSETVSSQEQLLEQVATPVGTSVTQDGVTVTLDSVMGDAHNALCVFSVERADGSPLGYAADPGSGEPLLYFNEMWLEAGSEGYSGSGSADYARLMDLNPNNNALQLVVPLSNDLAVGEHALQGKTARVAFNDLMTVHHSAAPEGYEPGSGAAYGPRYYRPTWEGAAGSFASSMAGDTWEIELLADGFWEFVFTLDYAQTSRTTTEVGQVVEHQGIEGTVTFLSVSPLGVTVEFDLVAAYSEEFFTPDGVSRSNEFLRMPMALIMADGNRVELKAQFDLGDTLSWNGRGWAEPGEGSTITGHTKIVAFADHLVDPAQVRAVSIGGVEVALG